MDKRIFLFEDYGNIEQHSVTNLEASEAAKLIGEGKAVELQLNEYDELDQQASKLYREYQSKRDKIQKSDDPRMTDKIKQYDLDKAYAELEQQTKALQQQWSEKRQELQAEARRKAARATVKVTESDKQTAQQLATRMQLNVMQASNPVQLNRIIDQAGEDIKYLSDAEKVALQSEIANVVAAATRKAEQLGGKVNTRTLLTAVQNVNNMDLLAGKVASQLPETVGVEFNRLRVIKSRR